MINERKNTSANFSAIIVIVIIAVIVGGFAFLVASLLNSTIVEDVTPENTEESLASYVTKVNPRFKTEAERSKDQNVNLTNIALEEEVPDISKYPFKVEGKGDINLEIISSPEKAGNETSNGNDPKSDVWLIEVVKNFNNAGYKVDGKSVSVSLRSISSGLAVDYITSGVYIPDAFSPSNDYWASMLTANGITLNKEADRLVGNTAGILLTNATQQKILDKYDSVNIGTIIEATANNEIAMGYTNPYASSAGLNFLINSLYSFDNSDPLSTTAIEEFQKFQKNVPFVAYNTMQMRNAVESGTLNGIIMEYQSYINDIELKSNYIFTPYGIRHDNPLYSIGQLSKEKSEAIKLFVDFATNEDSQKLANNYGFNANNDYKSENPDTTGETLISAQKLWKKEKDSEEIIAVFIIDTSGSVDGEPLNEMKESLINAATYINSNNYVGLITYNSKVTVNLPIAEFDLNQRSYFSGEIKGLSAGGGTRTFDAIAVGLQMLVEQQSDHPNAKQMLFVLSDGNSDGNLNSVRPYIENLNIPVYTIGYNANIEALEQISAINEAASINADTDDIIYKLKNLFNAQM